PTTVFQKTASGSCSQSGKGVHSVGCVAARSGFHRPPRRSPLLRSPLLRCPLLGSPLLGGRLLCRRALGRRSLFRRLLARRSPGEVHSEVSNVPLHLVRRLRRTTAHLRSRLVQHLRRGLVLFAELVANLLRSALHFANHVGDLLANRRLGH